MARLHRFAGLAFIAVFLATGAYMRATFPAAWRGDPGMRMMFRSAHIYILLSALLNLLASTAVAGPHVARPRLRAAASALLLLAPAAFTLAFFIDPAPDTFKRPIVLAGVISAAVGTVLFALATGKLPVDRPPGN